MKEKGKKTGPKQTKKKASKRKIDVAGTDTDDVDARNRINSGDGDEGIRDGNVVRINIQ